MSQHDMDLVNQLRAAFRADLNAALQALASTSLGATAPATTFAGQLWANTTNGTLYLRDQSNAAWIDTGVSITGSRTLEGIFDLTGTLRCQSYAFLAYGASGWALHANGSDLSIQPANNGTRDTTKGIKIGRTTGILEALNGLKVIDGDLEVAGSGRGLKFPDATLQKSCGTVVKIHTAEKTDTFTTPSATFTDVPGLSVTFTPASAASVMLVLVQLAAVARSSYAEGGLVKVLRGTTVLGVGAAAGSRTPASAAIPDQPMNVAGLPVISVMGYDAPASASPLTYKVQVALIGAGDTENFVAVNRSIEDTNDARHARTASRITIVELSPGIA